MAYLGEQYNSQMSVFMCACGALQIKSLLLEIIASEGNQNICSGEFMIGPVTAE